MTTKLTWTGSPDDQTARSGEYVLRAEEMNGSFSWWAVYFEREEVNGGEADTIEQAKTAAINAMNEHLKTCKD